MKKLNRKFLEKYKNNDRKCSSCGNPTYIQISRFKDGMPYEYYSCEKCGEEFLDMKQLHDVAEKYRTQKRLNAKISKWGVSLGVRIPKELVQKYKITEKTEITFIPEEDGIRMVI
jgi:ribosomal protein L37AE/L43A